MKIPRKNQIRMNFWDFKSIYFSVENPLSHFSKKTRGKREERERERESRKWCDKGRATMALVEIRRREHQHGASSSRTGERRFFETKRLRISKTKSKERERENIFYSTCSTQSMRREEERQRQRVEVEGQVEEEERREATRELIRKTEKLEIFLQQRPSAAELIEKNIIPRSVIDAGEATWQVKKALVTEAVFVFLFPKRHSLTSLSLFLSFFINSVSCAGA